MNSGIVVFLSTDWLAGNEAAPLNAVCVEAGTAAEPVSAGPLAELASRYGTDIDWFAILPIEYATVVEVQVPAKKRALFEKALPYALEDVLLHSMETQHFAYREPDRDGLTTVAAIDRALLKTLLERFTDVGIQLQGLYIDAQLLPAEENAAAALIDGERCLFRAGEQVAALRAADLAVARRYALGQCTLYLRSDRLDGNGEEIEAALVDQRGDTAMQTVDEPQRWLAQRLSEADPINLLQGNFRPAVKSDPRRTLLSLVAASALGAVVLLLVYLLGAGYVYQQRAAELHEQAVARYLELVPGAKRVVDVRKQLMAHVQANRAEAPSNRDFVEFFSDFSRAWSDVDMDESVLKRLRYEQANETAVLEIQNTTVSIMERLQAALSRFGFKATIASAVKEDNERSIVRLRIEGGR